MKRLCSQSGQATFELMTLLIGFVAVFLGLIFVCGLADSDLEIFLRARNRSELAASGSVQNVPGGLEFGNTTFYEHDIYTESGSIAFSPQDTVSRVAKNSISTFPAGFSDPQYSRPDQQNNPYFLQAKMEKWKPLQQVESSTFHSDFVTPLVKYNAFDAADLVSGTSERVNQVSILNPAHQKPGTTDALYRAVYKWFGVRISAGTLENAPGNRVYMPVFNRE